MICSNVYIILLLLVGKIIVVLCNESNSHPRLTMSQKFQILQNYFNHRDQFSFDNSEKIYDQIRLRSNSIDDSISLMKPTDENVSTKWSTTTDYTISLSDSTTSYAKTSTSIEIIDISENSNIEKSPSSLMKLTTSYDPSRDNKSSMHKYPALLFSLSKHSFSILVYSELQTPFTT